MTAMDRGVSCSRIAPPLGGTGVRSIARGFTLRNRTCLRESATGDRAEITHFCLSITEYQAAPRTAEIEIKRVSLTNNGPRAAAELSQGSTIVIVFISKISVFDAEIARGRALERFPWRRRLEREFLFAESFRSRLVSIIEQRLQKAKKESILALDNYRWISERE